MAIDSASNATSLRGLRLGLQNKYDNLVSNGKHITSPTASATITVGAEITNARAISVQLVDAKGKAINYAQVVRAYVFADAAGAAFATTGGSTGIAIGANGALLTVVAKKQFTLISDATGLITLSWTDTGTEAAYLAIELPTSGLLVFSSALTNA